MTAVTPCSASMGYEGTGEDDWHGVAKEKTDLFLP